MEAIKMLGQRNSARGRPRDPETDRAILRSTLAVLKDRGYAGMSIERVASGAGVSKASIYRRYASKEEAVAAALHSLRDELGPPPDTGSARASIIEMLLRSSKALASRCSALCWLESVGTQTCSNGSASA